MRVANLSLICSILFTYSSSAWAQGSPLACGHDPELEKYRAYIYFQKSYQAEDPLGDELLLWSIRQLNESVYRALKKETPQLFEERRQKVAALLKLHPEYAPEIPGWEIANQVKDDYVVCDVADPPVVLEGKKPPFRVRRMAEVFSEVIAQEYRVNKTVPQVGKVHDWSAQSWERLRQEYPLYARMPKLLMVLSRGVSSRYLVTGQEGQLVAWLLEQPERSVTIESIFRTSYRLHEGDVYLSLLTVENVLARFWLHNERERLAITTKLRDITNYNYCADKFGAWYHFFGLVLYGFSHGGLEATAVGKIESAGSWVLSGFEPERQEAVINSRSGRVGSRLRRWVESKRYETQKPNPLALQESFYLNLSEDFSERTQKEQQKTKATKK